MKRAEFVALSAMMFATIAFSIDSMLPALPEIAQELSPNNINRAQLILTSFVFGMGIGTLFTGPLSDRFGRKPIIYAGATLYIIASAVAWFAQSLELILIARVFQGLGAAGPRVVMMAVIRDLFAGREMAKIMSFVMLIFTLVPAIAPAMGSVLIIWSGWRAVFVAFILFSLVSILWVRLRLSETLAPEDRRPISLRALSQAAGELFSHPTVRLSIVVQALCYAVLFTSISTTQQIFDLTFDRADSFPIWYGGVALLAGTSSVINASLVMRMGMRFMVTAMLGCQIILSIAMVGLTLSGLQGNWYFAAFLIWQTSLFFQAGMTFGNLNAMAMEPMGHIAGMAASVVSALATVVGVMLAIPLGLAFDGTPAPIIIGVLGLNLAAFLVMLHLKRVEGRISPAT